MDLPRMAPAPVPLAEEVVSLTPLLASLPAPAMITAIDGTIRWANLPLIESTGYSLKELTGRNLRFLEPEPGGPALRGAATRLRETIWITKDGRALAAAQTAAPLHDHTGEISQLLWSVQLTSLVAPAQQTDTSLPFQAVFQKLGLLGVILDRNGSIGFANQFLLQTTGWEWEQVQGHNWFDLFLPCSDHREIDRETYRGFLVSGSIPPHVECELITRSGERRTISWNNVILRDPAGRITGLARIGEDVTDLKHAQDTLRQSEERHRSILLSAMDGFWLTDTTGRLLEVNAAYAGMSGYSEDELLQMTIQQLEANETPEETVAHMRMVVQNGTDRFQTRHRRKDGSIYDVEVCVHSRHLEGERLAVFIRDISAAKHAERQLRESHDLLTNLARLVPGVIYQFRVYPDGRSAMPYVSPGIQDIFEVSPEEVREDAAPALGRVHPEDRQHIATAIEDSARTLETFYSEFRVLLPRQGLRWRCSHAHPERTADGGTLWHGIVTDITESKLSAASLQESEARLRQAILSVPYPLMLHAEDGQVLLLSDAWTKVTGYSQSEIPTVGDWARLAYGAAAPLPAPATGGNIEITTRSGEARTWEVVSSPLPPLPDGRRLNLTAAIDLTERNTLTEEIRLNHEIVSSIKEGVLLVRASDTIIVHANPQALEMFGRTYDSLVGLPAAAITGLTPSAERLMPSILDELQRCGSWSGEIPGVRPNGESFWCSTMITSMNLNRFGHVWISVHRDISEEKRMRAEQARLEEQFNQAQKLESVGRLAGGVAHDFNNLLTVINGCSGFLLQGLAPQDRLRRYAVEIAKSGERAANLTRQLLAFSRKQVIAPKSLDMDRTLRDTIPMLQRIIGEDIRLNTHLDSSGGRVLSDPDQIQQVVMNLAVNARDAMPDGGKFRIATSCIDIEEGGTTALGPDAFAGNFIRLTIGDTGHGMDHATCQRIFEPFFTTKELGKGTGLGLSTVYGIVKQSGGWITVSSEPGVGTTFEIYLPRTDLPAATHITVRHNRIPDGRETILLVEDQDAVRAFTREALTRFGYTVLEAAAGEEALSLALGHNEPIHLLVTDVVLPGMNGKTLSEQLRRQRPDLKVLFVSGYSPDVISQRGVLEHGTEFLHKPFNPDALAEKVRKILGVRPAAPARILIAEDYQEVRRILAQHLRNSAYEVVEVSDGVAALEALQQRSADAAILDANMPRLGGLATAREIRRLYPETRIVLMSGAFDETSGTGAAGLGVDALFAKSGSPGGLLETLRRLGIGPPHTQVPDS